MKQPRSYNRKIIRWKLANYEWTRHTARLCTKQPNKEQRRIWVDINNILTKDTIIYYDLVIKEWWPPLPLMHRRWQYRKIIEKQYNLSIDPNFIENHL